MLIGLGLLELQHLIYLRLPSKKTEVLWNFWSDSLSFLGKSLPVYPVNAGVPQGSIFGPTPLLLYINDIPDAVICDIALYAVTTLYS